ncbi:MAG: hypothetical protein AB1442_13750 [Nitrospirota bacterium]
MLNTSPRKISYERLIKILKPYYSPLKAREGEGRPYLMRAIKSILERDMITVEPVGLLKESSYDPSTGMGFLLIGRCLYIDVVAADEFDPLTKYHVFSILPFIPYEMQDTLVRRVVINFGGDHSTKFIVNGKQTRTLATGVRIRHLTTNMLNGFYTMWG